MKKFLLVLLAIIFAPIWLLIILGHFITYPIVQKKRKKYKIENKYWNERVYNSNRCQIFLTTSHDLMMSYHHYYDDLNYDDEERKYAKEISIHFGGLHVFWKYGHKFLDKDNLKNYVDSKAKYYGLYCIDGWHGGWDSMWWGTHIYDLPWRRSKFVGQYIWNKKDNTLVEKRDGDSIDVLFINMGGDSFEKSKKISNTLKKMGIYSTEYYEPAPIKSQMDFVNNRKIPYIAIVDENNTDIITMRNMLTGEQNTYSENSLIQFFQNCPNYHPVIRVDIDTTYINKNNEKQHVPLIKWTLVERDYESQLLRWLGIAKFFRKRYIDLEFDCDNNGDKDFSGLGINADSWKGGTYGSGIKITKETEPWLLYLYNSVVINNRTCNLTMFIAKLEERIDRFMKEDKLY